MLLTSPSMEDVRKAILKRCCDEGRKGRSPEYAPWTGEQSRAHSPCAEQHKLRCEQAERAARERSPCLGKGGAEGGFGQWLPAR